MRKRVTIPVRREVDGDDCVLERWTCPCCGQENSQEKSCVGCGATLVLTAVSEAEMEVK